MKKAIGWTVSWITYWLGDFVSRCMHTGFTGWMYPAYNRLMWWSVDVQDWSGAKGPWNEPNKKPNAEVSRAHD